jgi:radical SAM protein (TIGR01212 family)
MSSPLERTRRLRPWLRATFGREVFRVALDAGSTCPNRDGTVARGGCVYCDVEGSGTGALRSGMDLEQQLLAGIRRVRRRDDGCGVIAYFQSYSNTYVPDERLEEVLAVVEPHLLDPVVCVALATRPDTLPDAALERLARLARRVPVWIELGLESADDTVLTAINRLHTAADFLVAVERVQAAGLAAIGHAILGLPGDGRDGARRTAELLATSGCQGVKVHHLMVLRRTQLAAWWREGRVEPLDPGTYTDWLADFVERLRPDQVLHRLTGDSPAERLLAPHWKRSKHEIARDLERELERRGTRQGERWAARVARLAARGRA